MSEGEPLRAGKEILKRIREEIMGDCHVSVRLGSKIARFVNEMVPDQFQVLELTAEYKLKQWAAGEQKSFNNVSLMKSMKGRIARVRTSNWELYTLMAQCLHLFHPRDLLETVLTTPCPLCLKKKHSRVPQGLRN